VKLFLTGVGGFIGGHLAAHWAALGHEVHGASHSGAALPHLRSVVPFQLGKGIPAAEFAGVEMVVHLAYDRAAGLAVNFDGTKKIYTTARAAGVPRQMLVSSYSARPDSLSEYGRLKYDLELRCMNFPDLIVRPGLVVGDGGLFHRNMRKILSTAVMPLLDGGRDLLPVVAIDDLVAAVTVLLDGHRGPYNLFNPELVTMRRFIQTINRTAHHRAFYFDVPLNLATKLLALIEKTGIKLPVDSDNLRALKQNQECIHRSDLERLLPSYQSFDEMIAAAVGAVTPR
jgi:nucleoside-diphosphate-sugar epimerase